MQIRDGEREFTAYLPGYYAVNTEGFSDEECAAYRAYLAEHERPICHFALDRYFEFSKSVTFSLDAESMRYVSEGCRQFGDAPQRYFARLLLWQLQQQEGVEEAAQTLRRVPVRIEVARSEAGGIEATASAESLREYLLRSDDICTVDQLAELFGIPTETVERVIDEVKIAEKEVRL